MWKGVALALWRSCTRAAPINTPSRHSQALTSLILRCCRSHRPLLQQSAVILVEFESIATFPKMMSRILVTVALAASLGACSALPARSLFEASTDVPDGAVPARVHCENNIIKPR